MRKVNKNLTQKPSSLSRPDLLDLLKEIEADKNLINSDIYRGKYKDEDTQIIHEEVVEALEEIYHGKCAYCEQHTYTYIEHYRPKKRIINTHHGGYFWLCYEWSNLVPTCHECNKIGGGKGDKFPIKNKRSTYEDCLWEGKLDLQKCIANQPPLIDENPYLLHPEIDNPIDFLTFEIDSQYQGIALKGLDGHNERGEQTIEICNLNRKELLRKRQESVIYPILQNIKSAFGLLSNQKIDTTQFKNLLFAAFEQLFQQVKELKLSFTLLRRTLIVSPSIFKSLVTAQLSDNQQEITQAFFESYFNSIHT